MVIGLERKLGRHPPGAAFRGLRGGDPPRPEGSGVMTETLVPIECLLLLWNSICSKSPDSNVDSSPARSRLARHHSLRPQRRQNCAKDGWVVPHARHKRLSDRAMSFRDEEVTIRTTT